VSECIELETARLRLRQWQPADYPLFAAVNADPEVMAYYPALLSEAESNVLADKIRGLIAQRGWGLWAVEEKQDSEFIGFTGLHQPGYELPFTPCVEVGWRLARHYWGRGYATEAARAALAVAFERLRLAEVYSFAALGNHRSVAVMQRIGMVDTGRNFAHPALPMGHPLQEHLLYRISASEWAELH